MIVQLLNSTTGRGSRNHWHWHWHRIWWVRLSCLCTIILFTWLFHCKLFQAFSALALLDGQQEGHLACKHGVVRYWHGDLSGARWKWFAYGPADAIATPSCLSQVKSRMVYISGAGLPRLSWKKAIKWM